MWSKNMSHASEQFVRSDQSDLSLCEYRLWANFLHCPIPSWGAQQSAGIIRLSNLEVMGKWDVSGDYSRPICRRIVETSGVPRERFGIKKKAASNSPYIYEQFLTPRSMDSYLEWLQHNRSKLIKGPFSRIITSRTFDRLFYKAFKSTEYLAGKVGSRGHSIKALKKIHNYLHGFETLDWANNSAPPWVLPLRRFLFPWAIDMAKKYCNNTNLRVFRK